MRSSRRGGRLREGAAHARGLARHLRRQHAGRQLPLRRQRVGAQARRAVRHAARDQEPEQLPFMQQAIDYEVQWQIDLIEDGGAIAAGHRAVRPRHRRDARDAQQGRRARLPLLPRPRPAAAGDRADWIERVRADDARAAARDGRALRSATTALPAYDAAMMTQSLAFAALLRGGARSASGQPKLAANWMMGEMSRRLNAAGHRRSTQRRSRAGAAGRADRAHRRRHDLEQRRARRCSTRCGPARAATSTRIIEAKGLKQMSDTGALETHRRRGARREPEVGRGVPRRQGQGLQRAGRPGR